MSEVQQQESQKAPRNTGKGVKRVFLKKEEKEGIITLAKVMSSRKIAQLYNISPRRINDIMRVTSRNQVNIFTLEEDKLLIQYYFINGITKPSELSRLLINKADWMIRNRIKKLKNKIAAGYIKPPFNINDVEEAAKVMQAQKITTITTQKPIIETNEFEFYTFYSETPDLDEIVETEIF